MVAIMILISCGTRSAAASPLTRAHGKHASSARACAAQHAAAASLLDIVAPLGGSALLANARPLAATAAALAVGAAYLGAPPLFAAVQRNAAARAADAARLWAVLLALAYELWRALAEASAHGLTALGGWFEGLFEEEDVVPGHPSACQGPLTGWGQWAPPGLSSLWARGRVWRARSESGKTRPASWMTRTERDAVFRFWI